MPLNFEPAQLTRGECEYEILAEIPSPASSPYVIIGIIFNNYGYWQLATWSPDGRARHPAREFDLVPAPGKRYANIYHDEVPVWHDDLVAATSAARPGRLCVLVEINDGAVGVHYQLLEETNNAS